MKKSTLNINYLNVYHLFNKVDAIKVVLSKSTKTIHLLGLSETRLDDRIEDANISIPNHILIRRDKQYDKHTGLAVYIHSSQAQYLKRREDLEVKEIECIWIELRLNPSTPLLVCFIYRNPSETANWLDKFETMLDNIPDKNHEIIIEGDINIDLNKPHASWEHLTATLGLSQLITECTRVTNKSKTLIDHIYTTAKNKVTDVNVLKTSISDHFMISCSYLHKLPKGIKKGHTSIQYRCYRNINTTSFFADLSQIHFDNVFYSTDPNIAMKTLIDMLKSVINKHAPLKTRRVKHPNLPSWLNSDIIKEMELRDLYKQQHLLKEYRKQRNKVSNMVTNAKKEFFNKLITDKKDTGSLWRAMNVLNNPNKGNKSQPINICPNTINDFFLNLTDTILSHRNIQSSKTYECPTVLKNHCKNKIPSSNFEIPYLSVHEVGKLISNLKNSNALGPDNISIKPIKLALPYIVDHLTYIYNLCIEKNIFPSLLKEAKVIPLPKTKDASHPQYLRPISLLPSLSKPLEKHIHKHMYHYLNTYNLLHPYQSGFRPRHSCHTALVRLCDTWLTAINKSELIGTVFLDFKKAFDLVNHRTLLKKLMEYFPKSSSIKLLKSYLSDRFQFVSLNGQTSEKKIIKSGVPQGSVLGPLFFLIYINDLPLHLHIHPLHPNNNTRNELFADDASIYSINKDINLINKSLQLSLNQASEWCNANSMAIHPDKTSAMVITTRQKHQLSHPKLTLYIGNKLVQQVNNHKMLGIYLDSELNWQAHINNLTKRLSKNVFLLSKLKKYVDTKCLKLFFDAHVMSHINYSSTVWDGCCKDTLNKVNRIHRRAIKIMSPNNLTTTDEKMKVLKILPLSKQLKYNKAQLIHKIYHGKTPPYLNQILNKATTRYGSSNLIAPLPRIDLFKTSLSYSGTEIWNQLPTSLKIPMTSHSFKAKAHKYYNDLPP